MTGTNIAGQLGAAGAVLGLATADPTILPVTGGTPIAVILGLIALGCGLLILGSLSLTEYLEKKLK